MDDDGDRWSTNNELSHCWTNRFPGLRMSNAELFGSQTDPLALVDF